MTINFNHTNHFTTISEYIDNQYFRKGNLNGLKIHILESEAPEKQQIHIADYVLTASELVTFADDFFRSHYQKNPAPLIALFEHLKREVPGINLPKHSLLLDTTQADSKSDIEHDIKTTLLEETQNLLEVLKKNEGIKPEIISTNTQLVEKLQEKVNEESTHQFILNINHAQTQILLSLAFHNPERYASPFLKKLVDLSSEYNFYRVSNVHLNLIQFAIYFKDLEILDEIQRKFPYLFESYIKKDDLGPIPPLHLALLLAKNGDVAKKLVDSGADVNYYRANSSRLPILFDSALTNEKETLELCLSLPGLQTEITDSQGQNVFHYAAKNNCLEAVQVLLQDTRFHHLIHEKNFYGASPIDIAYFMKNDEMIKLLTGNPTVDKTDLRYGKEPVFINQNLLIGKLTGYLRLKSDERKMPEGKIEKLVSPAGLCNGLSTLFFYYASKGKIDTFYKILETLISWDGKEDSLKAPFLETEFKELYENLEDLFEQTINDLVWFQQCYEGVVKIATPLNQLELEYLFSVVRDEKKDPEIKMAVFPFTAVIDKKQLAEFLDLLTDQPGSMVAIGGSFHATGLVTLDDGQKQFFDPNAKERLMKTNDNLQLATMIEELKYNMTGLHLSPGKMMIEFQILKVPTQRKEARTAAPPTDFSHLYHISSPNGFSPLHLAVFTHDEKKFDEILSDRNFDVNTKDKHGKTALYYATLMNHTDLILKLLNHQAIDVDIYDAFSLQAIVKFGNDEVLSVFLKKANVPIESALAWAIFYGKHQLAELVLHSGISIDIDARNFTGRTPLELALEHDENEICHLLLANGAKISHELYLMLKHRMHVSPNDVEKMLISMPDIDMAEDLSGSTLLHMASQDMNLPLIQLLKKCGANPLKENHFGIPAHTSARSSPD